MNYWTVIIQHSGQWWKRYTGSSYKLAAIVARLHSGEYPFRIVKGFGEPHAFEYCPKINDAGEWIDE